MHSPHLTAHRSLLVNCISIITSIYLSKCLDFGAKGPSSCSLLLLELTDSWSASGLPKGRGSVTTHETQIQEIDSLVGHLVSTSRDAVYTDQLYMFETLTSTITFMSSFNLPPSAGTAAFIHACTFHKLDHRPSSDDISGFICFITERVGNHDQRFHSCWGPPQGPPSPGPHFENHRSSVLHTSVCYWNTLQANY